ncbi:MAG: ankyrin repeat domain-containing protein [Candidatus Pacebacteria bacterium]|nr:ankyrin repeat domain-containing protein [Candidatus Paceibacterota bacterium]
MLNIIIRIIIYILIIITAPILFSTGNNCIIGGSSIGCIGVFQSNIIILLTLIIAISDIATAFIIFLTKYNKKDPGFKKFFLKTASFCNKYKKLLTGIFIFLILITWIGLTKFGFLENYLKMDLLYPKNALIKASEQNDTNKVKELIKKGLKINEKDNQSSALMYAVDNSNIEIVKELINTGADVNIRGEVNWNCIGNCTSLMYASYNGKIQIVKELINAGADVNAKNESSETVLMFAIRGEHRNSFNKDYLEIIKELINAGADVNAQNTIEATALMIAVYNGNTNIIKELINAGADVNAKDFQGTTVLRYASSPEIIKILKKAGAIE